MNKNILTGKQRLELIVTWIKRGGTSYMPKEDFIKKVCESKGIEYIHRKNYVSGSMRNRQSE